MNELSRRVEAAEREFVEQDLDQKLRDLEAAKQRQVTKCWKISHTMAENSNPPTNLALPIGLL